MEAFVGALAPSDFPFGKITSPKRVRVLKTTMVSLGESDCREPDPKTEGMRGTPKNS